MLDIIKPLIQTFSSGASLSKVWIFFIYVAVFFLVYKLGEKDGQNKKYPILFFIFVVISSILLIIGHFNFSAKNNLDPNQYYQIYSNNEISSNQLIHLHVGKAVFPMIIEKFTDLKQNIKIDNGTAFHNLIDKKILLLLFISNVLAAFFAFQIIKNYNFTLPERLVLLFSLFLIIKNLFDGGPLSYEFIPSLYFSSLILFKDNKKIRNFFSITAIILGTFVFYYIHKNTENIFSVFTQYNTGFVRVFSLLSLLYLTKKPKARVVLIIIFIILSIPNIERSLSAVKNYTQIIPENSKVYFITESPDFSIETIEKEYIGKYTIGKGVMTSTTKMKKLNPDFFTSQYSFPHISCTEDITKLYAKKITGNLFDFNYNGKFIKIKHDTNEQILFLELNDCLDTNMEINVLLEIFKDTQPIFLTPQIHDRVIF